MKNLTHLDLYCDEKIIDDEILHLDCNPKITDEGIKSLINLTHLKFNYNNEITDEGIKNLLKLTLLEFEWVEKISDEGIKHLKNLKTLNLQGN